MRCDNVQSVLSAYSDGELAPRQAARVAEHLALCSSCRAEYQSLGHVVTALRALGEEELPAGLHQAILRALDTARPSFWQRLSAAVAAQPVRPLAASAAAAALAVVALT